jgi:hypothetical protein|tara:strand:- start:1 stop:357 length:357 start_codon:yes stop_codon:yes gene_type:complete
MAVTSFYMGSLRYSPCGRKRKNHAANRVKKKPLAFKSISLRESQLREMRAQQQVQYNSLMEDYMKNGTYHTINGDCTKKETMKYTGTLVKGIATMHKSNAVPVISQEEATDIANMRRN